MKTIPATAGIFGISELGVWQLIRTHGIRTEVEVRLGKQTILVDADQIQAYFDEHPEALAGLQAQPK